MAEKIGQLDAVGLLCPLPVLRARKRLMSLAPGARLEVRATDPAAREDIPAFCARTGHELLATRHDGVAWVFLIRRRPQGDAGQSPQ
ncbi:hypothetical protein U879_07060 [Defluviimonas sp. 20V17]|uniref:tRNA 2-thiouridine synthesizing protein A n=1 Tax=Allgaiera indica TaxID=765699 RepID=A0AAN4UP14_9RHOB|nr:sulfurtransferase TusA family protein [Allgaiera indica]KDB04386.1 hypothetical protein U879_07060 [Defluviimonas sp. 20V17]GHD99623.1 hypothetical protein GCM10008024_07740 [Allgaiera indica]SDW21658.1 tRNA 2-thiouridine synthesizing protein A [Allgaiera indica]